MHYYQFNIGDYTSSTQHLEPMEDLAYRRMLDLYYQKESPLPKDIQQIARLIRMRTHCECIEIVLQEFFELTDEGYRNKGADKVLSKTYAKSEAARKSAKARWSKKDQQKQEDDANALRTHCEKDANGMLPNTQYPIPNTHNKDLVTDKRQHDQRFDFDEIREIWNEARGKVDVKSSRSDVMPEKAKKSLPKVYAKYISVCKAKGKDPSSRSEFCKGYFHAVLERAKSFTGMDGEHKNWKPNIEYASRVDTYDKVLEWLAND